MQVVCTGTMAVGSRKLAAHSVIVSRLGAIEELAGMTILCSDKTGTLTLNKLQMRDPWTMGSITPEQITFCACLASKTVNPGKELFKLKSQVEKSTGKMRDEKDGWFMRIS